EQAGMSGNNSILSKKQWKWQELIELTIFSFQIISFSNFVSLFKRTALIIYINFQFVNPL
ncbi:MAG: hypothetical protein PHO31_03105, partial [Candidatus Pacebacteria bacterium]|nr:hypothetical protein [Candidatus Paceibacterota bacterium]